MDRMNESEEKFNGRKLINQAEEMAEYVREACRGGVAAHEVERGLWRRVFEMGRYALGGFFLLHGDGDEGDRVQLEGGHEVKRLRKLHGRDYQSIFGCFALERVVYGSREGQKIEYVPLDRRIGLPESKFSYVLQDWNQALTVEMPYGQASAMLGKILGFEQSTHSLVRTRDRIAESVPEFWEAQPIPPTEEEGRLLVCTADGKGVPMRRATDSSGAETFRVEQPAGKGMRPGSKKMALLGSVYSVDPLVRTPRSVVDALFQESPPTDPPAKRPKPCFKRVRASLERDVANTTKPQVATIFGWMAEEWRTRNPGRDKPLILLMDGQESLWTAGEKYLPESELHVVEILDLLHASSYVWKAADLFYANGDTKKTRWVKKQLDHLLCGRANSVIRTLRRKGKRSALGADSLDELEKIGGYLATNAHRMAYDEYLKAGYPIASGVIEGACRCVVNDRMERSGMRWVIDGAQSMLGLRSIHFSALWDNFMNFHIHRETRRLYPSRAANDDIMSTSLAA